MSLEIQCEVAAGGLATLCWDPIPFPQPQPHAPTCFRGRRLGLPMWGRPFPCQARSRLPDRRSPPRFALTASLVSGLCWGLRTTPLREHRVHRRRETQSRQMRGLGRWSCWGYREGKGGPSMDVRLRLCAGPWALLADTLTSWCTGPKGSFSGPVYRQGRQGPRARPLQVCE